MSKMEVWGKTGDRKIQQSIYDFEEKIAITREFDFEDRGVTIKVKHGDTRETGSYEIFRDFDQGLLRTAWETMQREGTSANFKLDPTPQQRLENMQAVVAVVAKGLANDVVAPQKASFAKKGRRMS